MADRLAVAARTQPRSSAMPGLRGSVSLGKGAVRAISVVCMRGRSGYSIATKLARGRRLGKLGWGRRRVGLGGGWF
ncbi:hypothetical protein GCM10010961_06250 [Pseudodonghicola xiamenensis]|uniref:Uncharacterized protein n=1 Tax=Pseudodonghicola xiamenensis TaxID=337702 RepID=A0A8J3H3N1_9RHOB|nr:hypothetical protein GCM10010961_06250 [Pseudodonghicola xiamenensis]